MLDAPPGPGRDHGPAGDLVAAWLRRCAAAVRERRTWLTELDAAIGDGDHGINLDRGFAAVAADLDAAAPDARDPAARMLASGRRILGTVGGASGALYGRAFIRAGERLRAGGPDSPSWAAAFEAAVDGMASLGGARRGDKTMLDALLPALDALRSATPAELAGHRVAAVLERAATAAEAGAEGTIPLVARKGRASYLGERSAGHLDPGAASAALLVRCLADELAGRTG